MNDFVRTAQGLMDDSYTPTGPKSVLTLEYVENRLANLVGAASFLTTAAEIPTGIASAPYIFDFRFVRGNNTSMQIVGYAASGFTIDSNGRFTIPAPVAGSYTCQAQLWGGIGTDTLEDTLDFTLTIASSLIDASITTTTLDDLIYGQDALLPIAVSGTGPYRFSASLMPAGVVVSSTNFLTAAQAAMTIASGVPTQPGTTGPINIAVIGASGVKSVATFASGIAVLRYPEFVGLATLPVFPANTPGSWSFLPFVEGFPQPTVELASGALPSDNMTLTASVLVYGNLTSAAGTTTQDLTFKASSSVGSAQYVGRIQVATASADVPASGVIFSWTRANFSASDGAVISAIPDVAQGALLQMRAIEGFSGGIGPRWDSAGSALQFRNASGSTIGGAGIDCGSAPHAIGILGTFLSSTPVGVRQWYGSQGQFGYVERGVGGAAAAPVLHASGAFSKSVSLMTSYAFTFTHSTALKGVAAFCGLQFSTDRISTISISAAGVSTTLPRFATNTQGPHRAYGYFLGSGIPEGNLLNFNLTFDTAFTAGVTVVVAGFSAGTDTRILASSALATASTTLTTTLAYSGVPAKALGWVTTRATGSAIASWSSNMTMVHQAGYNTYGNHFGVQTTAGSANFAVSFVQSGTAANAVMIAAAIAEDAQSAGHALAIVNAGSLGYSPAIASLFGQSNVVMVYHESPTAGRARINDTLYSLSGGVSLSGLMNNVYLGGNVGADFNVQAIQVWKGVFDISGSQGTAMKNWLSAQATSTFPQPSLSTSVTAILDTDSRWLSGCVVSAARSFGWHSSQLTITGPSGLEGSQFRAVPEATGLTSNGRTVLIKTAGAFGQDVGRTYIRHAISNQIASYPNPKAPYKRIGEAPGYRTGMYGNVFWYAMDLVLDNDFYVDMSGRHNISLFGLHHVNFGSVTLTPFTAFLGPRTDQAGCDFFMLVRNNGGTLNNETLSSVTLRSATADNLVAGRRYLLIVQFKPQFADTSGFLKVWIREDNLTTGTKTWRNAGNPVLSYTGRVGHNETNLALEPRPTPAIYNWRSGQSGSAGVSPHNILGDAWPNTENEWFGHSGEAGFALCFSRGGCIRDTAGTVAVTRDTLAGFLDS